MIGKQPTASGEVNMAQTRGILLASLLFGLCVGTNPAAAEKKYDPGATDNEMRIGDFSRCKDRIDTSASDRFCGN